MGKLDSQYKRQFTVEKFSNPKIYSKINTFEIKDPNRIAKKNAKGRKYER